MVAALMAVWPTPSSAAFRTPGRPAGTGWLAGQASPQLLLSPLLVHVEEGRTVRRYDKTSTTNQSHSVIEVVELMRFNKIRFTE